MPLEMNNEINGNIVRETLVRTEYKGPGTTCGKDLRKLSHFGPWIPVRMHMKCWKQELKERADREYRIISQERDAVFMRAMNGDPTVAVKDGMRQRLVALQEKYIASDINLEDPAQMKQFHADAVDFHFNMRA